MADSIAKKILDKMQSFPAERKQPGNISPILDDKEIEIGPEPTINALKNKAKTAYDTLNAPKDFFVNESAKQLDFTRNSVTPKGNPEVVNTAKQALDLVIPGPADLAVLGGVKGAAFMAKHAPDVASKIVKGAKDFSQLNTLANEVGSVGSKVNTAADVLEKARNSGFGKTAVVDSAADIAAAKAKEEQIKKGYEYMIKLQNIREMKKLKP